MNGSYRNATRNEKQRSGNNLGETTKEHARERALETKSINVKLLK